MLRRSGRQERRSHKSVVAGPFAMGSYRLELRTAHTGSPMLRFDVGEDLLHYYCDVDRVTVYPTAPVNVAVGAGILRQIGAGAGDGGQEPRRID